jgi:hypothetical protein
MPEMIDGVGKSLVLRRRDSRSRRVREMCGRHEARKERNAKAESGECRVITS